MPGMSNSLSRDNAAGRDQILCRPVTSSEVRTAVALILRTHGRLATDSQVADFLRFSAQRQLNLEQMRIATVDGAVTWAALPVLSPGRTMLLFTPTQFIGPASEAAASALIESACDHCANREVDLAQVLLDPDQHEAREFFRQHEFAEMAELIYLHGSAHRSAKAPPLPPGYHWETYSEANHALFQQAILGSYAQSLDCPALNGLRHIDDVILGHQATGEFDPHLWLALCAGGKPVGVLLLCRLPLTDALELVYLGLAPEARGKGLGDLLLQESMHHVIAQNRRRLTLAVDAKNRPAMALYFRHGMSRIAAKIAMIRDLRPLAKQVSPAP
jgi:ribosomal protein S18 acetylase RimI-like enzyme